MKSEWENLSKIMEPVCNAIRPEAYAYAFSRNQFLKDITSAAQDYLTLPDPVQVASDIHGLEEKLRKGLESPKTLLDNLSFGAIELIEAHGEIPDFSALSNAEEIRDASRDLLGIITSSSKMVEHKSQRRTKHVAIGQVRQGRPDHRREEFLVGRLATAYAAATGLSTSRSWSDNDELKDYEVVVEHALSALKVHEGISARKLIERHIRNRNNPQ